MLCLKFSLERKNCAVFWCWNGKVSKYRQISIPLKTKLLTTDFFRVLVIDTSRSGHYSLQKWGKSWDSKFIVCQELCSWFGVNWFEAKGIGQGGQFQIRALSRLAGLIRFDWLQIFESLGGTLGGFTSGPSLWLLTWWDLTGPDLRSLSWILVKHLR